MSLNIKELFGEKMNDGSRHFVDMPVEIAFFDDFADHVEELDGAEITEFITDGIVEMWLEFTYRGHTFSVNNQFTDYWFFVEDPFCDEEILIEVISHFRKLTEEI
jgi:hypothetical protein